MPLCESMRMHSTSPFWCQTLQCLSRQSTQQKCMWASQLTGGLPTPSLRWCGDIPRGPKWRCRTSVGNSAKATTLGDGVHQQGHLIADNSSQNHPRTLPGSSPSMVIDTSFLPTLCYRVPQQGSHWSQSDRGDHRPLIKPHVWNARGILHLQFPPFNAQEGGKPPIHKRHSRITWSNHLPPLIGLHTGRYGWHHSSLQPLPLTRYSGEGHQPNSSCITSWLHQPISGYIAPSEGDEWCNGPSPLSQGHNGYVLPMGLIRNISQSSPKQDQHFQGYQGNKGPVCHCSQEMLRPPMGLP